MGTEMHNNTLITDQLKLVWDALNHCQKAGNNTPRRREIYKAMRTMHCEFMKNKDLKFANDCIDACLSYGTVEEMIKGRISSLYILPVILNALTASDSVFKHGKTEWIVLNDLRTHLKKQYTNHLATYFTLTYLFRIIANAKKLFAFHKDYKKMICDDDELRDEELKNVRFKVRKNAYQQNGRANGRRYNNFNY